MAKRVTLLTGEMLGVDRNGGLGTAMTFLALALGRLGHRVEILYTSPLPQGGVTGTWMELYERFDVRIRTLDRAPGRIEPRWLRRPYEALLALRDDPPDVVVAQDWGGPAYAALRMRDVGFDFPNTSFVVACHGTTRWIAEAHRKTPNAVDAVGLGLLERASVELADVVVSPSAYMLDWMRGQGWRLPEKSLVIPNLTRTAALDESPPEPVRELGPPHRLAFFGRIEERKGVGTLLAALEELDPAVLDGVELWFLGAVTTRWSTRRISEQLARSGGTRLAGIRFETALDQPEALAELRRPGTLAIMPSYLEHSPCTVSECLEHGIPFLATAAGGTPELIAEEDRSRVLVEPHPVSLAQALSRLLSGDEPLPRAHSRTNGHDNVARWAEIISESSYAAAVRTPADPEEWTLVMAHAIPEDGLQKKLLQAQSATGADIVTCGAQMESTVYLFHGEPGPLGVLANHYGAAALVRRTLLDRASATQATGPAWPLLARLSLDGARVVSVPEPLVRVSRSPHVVDGDVSSAAAVLGLFEAARSEQLEGLPRLAVALAGKVTNRAPPRRSVVRLLRRVLRGRR